MKDSLLKLAAVLKDSNAKMQLRPERMVSSFYYDPTYSFALFASVIRMAGRNVKEQGGPSLHVINSTLLRFISFCAVRPYLLESLKKWKEDSTQPSLLDNPDFRSLPQGFLMDTSLADSLLFLVCTRNLQRHGVGGSAVALPHDEKLLLNQLYEAVVSENLLVNERKSIEEVLRSRITLTDLGLG